MRLHLGLAPAALACLPAVSSVKLLCLQRTGQAVTPPCTPAALCNSVGRLADEAGNTAMWTLYGVAALFCGALFGAVEGGKAHQGVAADQLFLKVMRRKSSRWGWGAQEGARERWGAQ